MKKVLLVILGSIVVVGALAGAGFAGYRIGYQHGTRSTADGNTVPFIHGYQFGPQDMPMHNFGRDLDRGFNRGWDRGGFGMQGYGMRFGFFPSLMPLGHIVFWGLVIWFVYWLFTRSGWKFSLTRHSAENPKTEPDPNGKTE